MARRLFLICVVIGLLIAPIVVQAQGNMSYGQQVTACLDGSGGHRWAFYGARGDVVEIDVASTDFDTVAELHDPTLTMLTQDDDGGNGTNSHIHYTLPTRGEFGIVVHGYSSGVTGCYVLALNAGGTSVVPPSSNTNPNMQTGGGYLSYGDIVNAQFNRQACHTWTFDAVSGDVVSISMSSTDFDSYLELYDPYNSRITFDDDSFGGLDALIDSQRLSTSGRYSIEACSYGQAAVTGIYAIYLSREGVGDMTNDATLTTDVVNEYLPAGENYGMWSFDAVAGDGVAIWLDSDDFDTYLELYDPLDRLLASDDDSGGNLNSALFGVTLPMDGTYVILVSSFDHSGSGNYTLGIEHRHGGNVISPTDGNTARMQNGDLVLTYGQTGQGYLDGTSGHRWSFWGDAGDRVSIRVRSSDFDTVAELHDPTLTMLTQNDDSSGGTNSYIEYTLPVTGEYGIVVHGYSSGAVGYYDVSLSQQ